MQKFLARLSVFLFVFLLFSCSSEETQLSTPKLTEEVPDMILYNALYTLGKPDRSPLTMRSELITIYEDEALTTLQEPSFTQKNFNTGEIEIEGSCGYAESRNDQNVTLSKGVKLTKKSDNVTIECNELIWDDQNRSLYTDSTVHLTYEDGSEITVNGFTAYLDDNIYEFKKIIEGRFVFED